MYLFKIIAATAVFCFACAVYAEININTATVQQLTELDNIGVVKASAIVEYRTKHGHFQSVDDLLNVNGIGMAILEANRDMLSVATNQNRALPIEKVMPAEKHHTTEAISSSTDKEN